MTKIQPPTKPANVSDEAWAQALLIAREDPKRIARLVAAGLLIKQREARNPHRGKNLALRPKRRK